MARGDWGDNGPSEMDVQDMHENLTCLNEHDGACDGAVEYRMALSGTGRSFPRCEKHWEERLDIQDGINQRYPVNAPSDFDPSYAGEHWDEEY